MTQVKAETEDLGERYSREKRYRKSFVNKEGFEGKRFERYVKKVKDYLLEDYIKITYPMFFYGNTYHDGIPMGDITDFIVYCLQSFYLYDLDTELPEITDLIRTIHSFEIQNKDKDLNEELLEDYLDNPYKKTKRYPSLEEVIDKEIIKACKDYIRMKTLEMEDVTESNYFKTLPSTISDAVYIFDMVINYVRVDIDNLCASKVRKRSCEKFVDKEIDKIIDEKELLANRIKELEKEASYNENVMKSLREKLKEKDQSKKSEIKIDEESIQIKRQYGKLEEKYNRLLEKYVTLKNRELNEEDEEDDEKDIDKDIKLDGRYLFVAYDDITFKNNIINVFGNGKWYESNADINAATVDLVVVLTDHIDHATYYEVKNQCKSKGVPFLHCKYTNVELIKDLIRNYYEPL